ncbi:hypothetical protein DAI22_11g107800 [Oryza sativa Japonica Group]|nr:hypothetical protein DAI22_11g107800 [Oryza sativa Japonica Group]
MAPPSSSQPKASQDFRRRQPKPHNPPAQRTSPDRHIVPLVAKPSPPPIAQAGSRVRHAAVPPHPLLHRLTKHETSSWTPAALPTQSANHCHRHERPHSATPLPQALTALLRRHHRLHADEACTRSPRLRRTSGFLLRRRPPIAAPALARAHRPASPHLTLVARRRRFRPRERRIWPRGTGSGRPQHWTEGRCRLASPGPSKTLAATDPSSATPELAGRPRSGGARRNLGASFLLPRLHLFPCACLDASVASAGSTFGPPRRIQG